jgi:hypothetical protein
MYPPSPTLDHLLFRRCFLLLPIFAAFLGSQLVVLPARPAAADDNSSKSVPSLDALIERMAVDGRGFDPQPLLDQGVAGMRAVLDHLFPETIVGEDDRRAEVKLLIEQLGDDSFERREEADARLRKIGWSHAKLLREALEHKDPEVRFRVRKMIRSWEEKTTEQTRKMQATYTALQTYLEKLDDLPSQQELARRVALALGARLDQTIKAPALKICLQAMAQWKVDLVHEELLPLLKHEDPAVAIFAMRGIAGRTGNSYIAPIHMGAIASGRRELVKCGFRSMPCPIWDRKNKPIVRELYVKIFDAADEQWDFSNDEDFMRLSAFVAARDFHITNARDWLLRRMASDDEKIALRAIRSLGDTYYMRRPIYPELLAAVEPHLSSDNPKFRAAAIYTIGVYQGDAVPPLLLKAFADPDKQVWQTAGRRLADQHSYHPRDKSPIPKLLAAAIEQTDDPAFKARAQFLLNHVQQDRPGYLRWEN